MAVLLGNNVATTLGSFFNPGTQYRQKTFETAAASGNVTSLHVIVDATTGSASNLKLAMIDSGGNILVETAGISKSGGSQQELSASVTSTAITAISDYNIMILADGYLKVFYDGSNDADNISRDAATYPNFVDPFVQDSTVAGGILTIWAEGTVSGGVTLPVYNIVGSGGLAGYGSIITGPGGLVG